MIRFGPPPGTDRMVVVAVHGRGQDPSYLAEHLVRHVRADLAGVDDVAWLLPAAPRGSWYPGRFLDPVADNQPDLDAALATIDAIAAELAAAGTADESIVWAGFSQGACLVTEWTARNARRWGGLVALTGGLIGPPGTAWCIPPAFGGMPAYFGVSARDVWVPVWRVEETVAAFVAARADVEFDTFPDAEHVIRASEVARVVELLNRVRAGS